MARKSSQLRQGTFLTPKWLRLPSVSMKRASGSLERKVDFPVPAWPMRRTRCSSHTLVGTDGTTGNTSRGAFSLTADMGILLRLIPRGIDILELQEGFPYLSIPPSHFDLIGAEEGIKADEFKHYVTPLSMGFPCWEQEGGISVKLYPVFLPQPRRRLNVHNLLFLVEVWLPPIAVQRADKGFANLIVDLMQATVFFPRLPPLPDFG